MRHMTTVLGAIGLLGIGYLLGSAGTLTPPRLLAQAEEEAPKASAEAVASVKAAHDAVNAAMEALMQEELYVSATTGTNAFSVLAGGIDAVKDLDSGRGVDPGTFAALYAGLATPEVKAKLEYDSEHRLLYNGKLVRMYPISRLKAVYALRDKMGGAEQGGDEPSEE